MRESGILLPVASLASEYGIGCFDVAAYEFVDRLEEMGQSVWQILPVGPTGYGDSPYQSFSTFAGNPYFLSLKDFISRGWLTEEQVKKADLEGKAGKIDYHKQYKNRFPLLRTAYRNSHIQEDKEFLAFLQREEDWLFDYGLFMAIKDAKDGASYQTWEEEIRRHEPDAVAKYTKLYEDEILFYEFLQYEFERQWQRLKNYANRKGIRIFGDIPIYVAADSADTWSHPELFQLDDRLVPVAVAGCPPDAFSETGQLWGNPLYRWEKHKEEGYAWWIKRMEHAFLRYDMLRIDHFRGFHQYYSIPYGEATAVNGHWEDGPGLAVFEEVKKALGEKKIIAEDLGFLTDGVKEMLAQSGFPGMKVLQFAFDAREESDYMPHNYERNCVVYTGTHDNPPTMAWWEELSSGDLGVALRYLSLPSRGLLSADWSQIKSRKVREELTRQLVILAMRSVGDLCIIPIADYLLLEEEARINTPSTLGGNWEWRMGEKDLTPGILEYVRRLTKRYGRERKST